MVAANGIEESGSWNETPMAQLEHKMHCCDGW